MAKNHNKTKQQLLMERYGAQRRKEAVRDTVVYSFLASGLVLEGKFGFDRDMLHKFFQEAQQVFQDMDDGRLSLEDIAQYLLDEIGVSLEAI